ncbi:MAG: hypothetical protein AB7U23_11385 [Dehalococcoidia bacterium]
MFMQRMALVVLVGIAMALVACGGDSEDSDADPVGAAGASQGESGATSPAGPSTGQAAPSSAGRGSGTVSLNGTEYDFVVRSCAVVNGKPNLGGDGAINVALGAGFLVQLPGGASYTVRQPVTAVQGKTVTASGTGSNLAAANDLVPVALEATCSDLN